MKTCSKPRGKTLDRYWIHNLNLLIFTVLSVGFFALGIFVRNAAGDRVASFWRSVALTPEPDCCVLCGEGRRYHAPCLIELSTGTVLELQIYDRHPDLPGELSPVQQTGTFSLLWGAGVTGYRDTNSHTCYARLPGERQPIAPAHFCLDCRALLAKTATEGYILLDLYDLSSIQAYPVLPGLSCTIRDYGVSIARENETGGPAITVKGRLS